MRERSTWKREEVMSKAAALRKVADPYTMNQDHPQPAADAYVIGDPSAFAEDVHTPNTWEAEYSADQTRRNEIGMPEMRADTFNHMEKTAKEVLLKKADLCIAVAQLMMPKTASELQIEDQSVSLMHLPDQELIDTHKRLAGEDEDDDQGQEQQKQAQDDQGQEDDQGQQQKQAQDDDKGQEQEQQQKQAQDDDKDQEQQQKQANDMQQMAQQVIEQIQTGNLAQAQQQIQEMIQAAQQQQQVQQQVEQQGQPQQQVEQQQQVGQGQQQQIPPQQAADDQMLDQMLAGCGRMGEGDIEMEPAQMDIGMDDLGPEDEVLRTLFADDQQQEKEEEQQQKEAARTASVRTVGTRPTGGVSKLGGTGAKAQSSIDQLSSLWQSAPDVRDAFGLK